jgi:hypothetical protein
VEQDWTIQYRWNCNILVNNRLRLWLKQEHHNTALAGYPGWAKTFNLLDWQYYWKDMWRQVDEYGQNCDSCQQSRRSEYSQLGVCWALTVSEKPWENSSIDFVLGLPNFEGLDAFWVVVERLTKMRRFIHRHTTIKAI